MFGGIMTIEDIIYECLSESKLTPYEINTGNCDAFAEKVTVVAERYNVEVKLITNDRVGHIWVKHSGKYYDAETPKGVTNWRELVAVKRSILEV
jgi:hypothetical protein